ncbi:MAG: alpha/beta fold hydrolase [Pseudomonadota bacterium]|nr:alpha/beta fold hydrolase [Pseudomonadota bacterium]
MTIRALLFALSLAAAGAAHAAEESLIASLNETVFKLPASVTGRAGATVSGQMTVTQFKPDGAGPFPIAILLHGRALDRAATPRFRYTQAARYFVRRGFAVLVPTRLGYGESGVEPDPEQSGGCTNKLYAPAFDAVAASALDLIAYAGKLPFADPARIVVLGQSFGGAGAIALAARQPAGVVATINFAGGGGGDPDKHPGSPCHPERLESTFASYGATSRLPTLWLYTENDRWMGATEPKRWFAAYAKTGGTGDYAAMPAFGEDGHALFAKGFEVWRPLVDQFLSKAGFAIPKSVGAPAPTGFARLGDVHLVPVTTTEAREQYQRFLKLDVPRAYAIGPRGGYAFLSAPDAVERVLASCRKQARAECKLYAVDDDVVWKE